MSVKLSDSAKCTVVAAAAGAAAFLATHFLTHSVDRSIGAAAGVGSGVWLFVRVVLFDANDADGER